MPTTPIGGVLSLLAPMLGRERCLLVTGYQDFLSAMSILVELRPGIAEEKAGRSCGGDP
jgi:hypothetical protein